MNLPTLDDVANELAKWRETRLKRGPIPENLRIKIGHLYSHYPTIKIINTLGLNTAQLKHFSQIKEIKRPIEFVRIAPPSEIVMTKGIACELKRPDGSTLQCTVPSSDLKTFMQVFLCSH